MPITEAGSSAANEAAGERLTAAITEPTAQNDSALDIHVTADDLRAKLDETGKMEVSKVDELTAQMVERAEAAGCEPCIFAAEHGHWGKTIPAGWTHDKDSHITFPGSGRWGSCSGCGDIFSGQRTFDDHHSAHECRPGARTEGDTATWRTHKYVVKAHESGFLYWGSADVLDPSVFA